LTLSGAEKLVSTPANGSMTCGDDFREALTRPWPLPLSIPAVTAAAAAAAASPLPLRYPGFSSSRDRGDSNEDDLGGSRTWRSLSSPFSLSSSLPFPTSSSSSPAPATEAEAGATDANGPPRPPTSVTEAPPSSSRLPRSAAAYFTLRASPRVSARSSASRIAAFQGSSPFSRKRSVYARDSRSSSSVCRSVFVKRKEVSDGS